MNTTTDPSTPTPAKESRRPRVLAISSGGGHWVQLLRLRPAFEGCDVVFVTVLESYRAELAPGTPFHLINDATRWNKLGLIRMLVNIARIILYERPDVIVSTGAAPGYFAIRLGKLLGARGVWIDSIANVETLSMSGQKIGRHADLWLTQWPHLAEGSTTNSTPGPRYEGSVL